MNVIPKLSQLSPRVWRILGCNPGHMTLQGTNVYLVGTGPRRVLIDAGQDGFPEYVDNLFKLLKEKSVFVDNIIITHWHHDHIGALKDLHSSFETSKPKVLKYRRNEVTSSADQVSTYPFGFLEDNQVIETEGATLKIHHTPGHTTDHISVYLKEENALFSGDCILGEGTAIFEDLYDYMKSLDRILQMAPSLIYPAHGPIVENPVDKIKYYIEHRNQREKQIMESVKVATSPMTSEEIVKVVYRDVPEHLHAAAEVNVIHHLTKLCKDKQLQEKAGKYFVTNAQL